MWLTVKYQLVTYHIYFKLKRMKYRYCNFKFSFMVVKTDVVSWVMTP
jgi:hypothetical protein